jgi:hypothetical protein
MKQFLTILICFTSVAVSFAQFDKPTFRAGIGISEPFNDLKGTYYSYGTFKNFQTLNIDSNLISNNYGGKTGLYFFGSANINFDKYSILRGTAFFSFNTFNTFEPRQSGNGAVVVLDLNGNPDTVPTPVNYNYNFSNFALGLGLEIAPLSFTNLITPFFNANICFNFMNASIDRTENSYDTNRIQVSDFRIGVNLGAGIEMKFSKQWGMVLGMKYDLGNLLLKNTQSSVSDRMEWGRTNAGLNDEQGYFYSSIPRIIGTPAKLYSSKTKKIDWGTIYLGVSYTIDLKEKTKKSEKK